MRYREHEVGLHDDQDLDDADAVQVLILLRQLENAFLRPPVLRRLELQKRALGIARIERYRLALLDVEAGDPHVVVHGGGVHRGEVLHDLERHEPGVHQQRSCFIDPILKKI